MKLQRRRLGRRPPSEAVSFMQQLAGNRLAEVEVMFLTEFEHTPNGFRLAPAVRRGAFGAVGRAALSTR